MARKVAAKAQAQARANGGDNPGLDLAETAAPNWPADRVIRRPLTSLVAYARNARTHTPTQVEQVAKSIKEFGWTIPVLTDESGMIIAGHARVLAAEQLGLETVPTMSAIGWSDEQKRAYVITDNKLAQNAGWDDELLRLELGELKSLDFDLDLTGFTGMEVEALFAPDIDPTTAWEGMPEFDQQDKLAFRSIVVHFKDQDALDKFAKLIKQKISEKTRFTWFPQVERETYADKRYTAAGATGETEGE